MVPKGHLQEYRLLRVGVLRVAMAEWVGDQAGRVQKEPASLGKSKSLAIAAIAAR
jgi:hypothetical protein